jgi:hypothetical protein
MFRIPSNLIAAGIFALVLLVEVAPASAQQPIPDSAGNGRLTIVQWPVLSIDGHELRAAPGARIFASTHRTVTPNAVPADTRVRYLLNGAGQVQTIWLMPDPDSPAGGKK